MAVTGVLIWVLVTSVFVASGADKQHQLVGADKAIMMLLSYLN